MASDNPQHQNSSEDKWLGLLACVSLGAVLAGHKIEDGTILETLFVVLVLFPPALYVVVKGVIGLLGAFSPDGNVGETVGCLGWAFIILVGGALGLLVLAAVVKWSFGVLF